MSEVQESDLVQEPKKQFSISDDYLANALIWLCQYDQNSQPKEAILEGLGIHEQITIDDFCQAAEKIGYQTDCADQKVAEIEKTMFPCIIQLKNDKYCIMLDSDGVAGTIVWPKQGYPQEIIPLAQIEQMRNGYIIFIKPKFVMDERAHHPHLATDEQWFWNVLRKTYPIYGEVFLASIFINIFAVITSLFSMNVYDRVVPNSALETLYTLALGMLLMNFFDFLLKVMRSYFLDHINKKTDVKLTSMIFDHLLHIKLQSKPKSVGSFSSMINQFESFRDFFTSATMATIIDIPFTLFFIAVIWFLGGPLVLTVLIAVPLVAVATIITQKMSYERVKLSMKLAGQKNAILIEYLASLEAIKFWGAQHQMQQRWDSIIVESAKVHGEIKTIQTVSSYFCQLVQSLSYISMIVYGVILITDAKLTMGALIGSSILSSRAIAPILQVGQLMLRWQQAKSSLDGMDQLMKMPLETKEHSLSVHDMAGHFKFIKAKFQYPDAPQPALIDIDLDLRPGQRIGIVGSNGSGKSTLVKMLLGLYSPTEGNVLLDGMDINQFHMTALRKAIGYVPQDIHLIHGTLRENITMGYSQVAQEDLIQACKEAGLMEFIGGHPKGLDMVVGERGETLSGGQRQAIALARALIGNPKILILDEPTSALDYQAENNFIENVGRIIGSRTLIMVSHRQSPLKLCKELVIMNQGRIVARQPLQVENQKQA